MMMDPPAPVARISPRRLSIPRRWSVSSVPEGWRSGAAKSLERQFAANVAGGVTS
jgi:hypothetical protein